METKTTGGVRYFVPPRAETVAGVIRRAMSKTQLIPGGIEENLCATRTIEGDRVTIYGGEKCQAWVHPIAVPSKDTP